MTILFAGGEECDFTCYNQGFSTDTANFRSGFARGGVSFGDSNNTDPNTHRIATPFWLAPASDFWLSFYSWGWNDYSNMQTVALYDPSDIRRLLLRTTGSGLKLSTRTAAGVITDVATVANLSQSYNWGKLDIHIIYGSPGSVAIYRNGTLLDTISGSIATDGATQLQRVDLGGATYRALTVYSEVIVSTTDTRGMGLVTLTNASAGANQQWTGTASNPVSNNAINDANFIYSDTNDQIQEYLPKAITGIGSYSVVGLAQSGRLMRGALGPQHAAFVARLGSTEYLSSDLTLGTGFANYSNYIQETNPATGLPWTAADIAPANLQFGVKSKA